MTEREQEILALLRQDQVDFAVGSMLDVPHDLSYEPVQWYDPMLILPRGHPLAGHGPLPFAAARRVAVVARLSATRIAPTRRPRQSSVRGAGPGAVSAARARTCRRT